MDDGTIGISQIDRREKHVESLVDSIQSLFKLLSIDFNRIEAIAVDVGPGLFTGIRTGIATVMAMVKSKNLKALPVTSLDILAYQGDFIPSELIVPVIDAKKDEIYTGVYIKEYSGEFNPDITDQLRNLVSPVSLRLDELFDSLAANNSVLNNRVILYGSGVNRYFEELNSMAKAEDRFNVSLIRSEMFEVPSVKTLIKIAGDRLSQNAVCSSDLKPIYLRPPNIKIGWQTRQ